MANLNICHLIFISLIYKIVVKKQPYQMLNTICELFPLFDASNFHNWLLNLRKIGQISLPFCILYE